MTQILISFTCGIALGMGLSLWLVNRRLRRATKPSQTSDKPSWIEEQQFWFEKANRAFIRCEDAIVRNNHQAADVARKQHALYTRRMNASVPKDVREKWELERAAERKAAFEEMKTG